MLSMAAWLIGGQGRTVDLVISLLRPWCNFLCPIRAVSDYIRMLRNWGKEILKNVRA